MQLKLSKNRMFVKNSENPWRVKVRYGYTSHADACMQAKEVCKKLLHAAVECNYSVVLHAYFLTIFRKYDFAAYFCVPL